MQIDLFGLVKELTINSGVILFSYSNLVALGCIQGIVLSIYLFRFLGPNRILAIFLSLLSINMCVSFYVDSGLFDSSMYAVSIWESLNSYLLLGPVLTAFVIKLINPERHFNKVDTIHLLPFILYLAIFITMYPYELSSFLEIQGGNLQQVSMQSFEERFSFVPLATTVHFCLYLLFCSGCVFQFWLTQRGQSISSQLSWLVMILTISYLMMFSIFIVSITATLMELDKSHYLLALSNLTTVAGIFAITFLLIRIGKPNAKANIEVEKENKNLPKSRKSNKIKATITQQNLLIKLDQKLEVEKYYLQSDFNQAQLAKCLQISRHQLSDLLTFHPAGNFYELISQLRVEAVIKELKMRPMNEKLIDIAYDCGFNSKSNFNQVFKKYNSQTPSQYRKLIRTASTESFSR